MAPTKYLMSNGLAFSENKDMEKLRKKALKGWNLKKFRFMGYELEKGECEDVIFSIDYRKLQPGEQVEYFDMFSDSGWEHVCSSHDMHIFKAKKGTIPIYSDVETSRDKLERLGKPVQAYTVFMLALTVILWTAMTLASGFVQTIVEWIFLTSVVLAVPAIMTTMAITYHKWKNRRKYKMQQG
ncbi:DUF2812 domain-containing protein [Siminovitchia sediminis]|uniref:DUF2812 domain-containing protein n=1 Tax=Siminovitchia sediminis TaxID=1274353 RepID=A0ABW4KFT3_9BACI